MSKDPQLYIIQDSSIQGQAGKTFSHEPGDNIKFPDNDVVVKNVCLCNYRYYQYYVFYQYLPQDISNLPDIQIYSLQLTKDGYRLQTDDNGLFTFETDIVPAFGWYIHSGPEYIGCHPAGTFQTGVWLPIGLPYKGEWPAGGITQPAPRYVYKKQFRQGSLKCMYVTTYKCCNGVVGCGVSVSGDGSNSFLTVDLPFFAADFYITGIFGDSPTATLVQGTEKCYCDPATIPRTFIRHSCDSATATGYYSFNLLPGQKQQGIRCGEICAQQNTLQQARDSAIGYARARLQGRQCVYWMLWRCVIPDCNAPCIKRDLMWQLVSSQQWSSVPADVAGKGAGLLFPEDHTKQIITKCDQHTVYQWVSAPAKTYNQAINGDENDWLAFVYSFQPSDLTQNPCKDSCGYNPELGGFDPDNGDGDTSGSISGAGSLDTPCNSPDPYARVYLDYGFQTFDIYYLTLTKKNQDDIDFMQNPTLDPCKDYYIAPVTTDPSGKKKLDWTLDVTGLKDYQILQRGRIRGTTFLNWNKDKTKFYMVVPNGQDPPQDQSDSRMPNLHQLNGQFLIQDTGSNKCDGVYQCYYMGCVCPDPCSNSCSAEQKVAYITGGCHKWNYIGRISPQELLQRGLCLNKWQASTPMRTGGGDTAIGIAVYTTTSKQPDFCDQYPQPPQKIFQYVKLTVSPGCSEEQDDDVQSQLVEQTVPLCGQKSPSVFGWKKQDSLSSSQTLQFEQDYGYIDVSQDSDTCQLYYFGPIHEGLVLYDQMGHSNLQTEAPDFDTVFSNAKPSIIWNYPVCRNYIKRYWYNVYKATPDKQDQNKSEIQGPDQQTADQNYLSDAEPVFGWVDSDNPFIAKQLLQDANGNIIPRTAQMASDSYLCTVYLLQKTGHYSGCPQTVQKQSQSLSPAQLLQLVISPILWDRHSCLQYYTAIKYAYVQFQLNCRTSVLTPVGMQLPPNWQVQDPIRLPDVDGVPQSPQSLNWGWLDNNSPLTGSPLLTTGPGSILPTTVVGASSDSYLCTVYYVHSIAVYYGSSQDPVFSDSVSYPDLSGYVINWNPQNCLGQYSRVIVYRVTSFVPTCNNQSGNIDGSNVSWTQVRNTDVRGKSTVFGWCSTNDPTTAQAVPTSFTSVNPGNLCQVYYIQLIASGYFCGDPPSGWPTDSVTPPNFSGWSINWDRKSCLDQCVWYAYIQTIITPECATNQTGYENVVTPSQQPVLRKQCDSNASSVQLPTGYFVKRNNTWVAAPANNGTIIIDENDACQVLYRVCVFTGIHCGEPQQSEFASFDPNSLISTPISWPSRCIKTYNYYTWQQAQLKPVCTDRSKGLATGWKQASVTWLSNQSPPNIHGYTIQEIGNNTTILASSGTCKPVLLSSITHGTVCKTNQVPSLTPPGQQEVVYDWSNQCLISNGWKWYQNYIQWTFSKKCSNNQFVSTSQCAPLAKSGTSQQAVNMAAGWTSAGNSCKYTYSSAVGAKYVACNSNTFNCTGATKPTNLPAFTNCNAGSWYQNYVRWTYTNSKCNITSSSANYYVSGNTSAAARNSVNTAWQSITSCKKYKDVLAGNAYSACSANNNYSGATAPGSPSWTGNCGNASYTLIGAISCWDFYDYDPETGESIYYPHGLQSVVCTTDYKIYVKYKRTYYGNNGELGGLAYSAGSKPLYSTVHTEYGVAYGFDICAQPLDNWMNFPVLWVQRSEGCKIKFTGKNTKEVDLKPQTFEMQVRELNINGTGEWIAIVQVHIESC